MKIEFHTLYWPGTNSQIVESHKKVMNHFSIPINYHEKKIDHGQWMTNVLENAKSDLICFFDIDCVPIKEHGIWTWIDYVKRYKTFCGVAQVSNHLHIKSFIYAAPAFFVIHKSCWNRLDTDFLAYYENIDGKLYGGDVAEKLSHKADELKIQYGLLMPEYVHTPKWRLSDKGCYGTATIFSDTVYHLYESRYADNIELFKSHCVQIIKDEFNYYDFYNAKTFKF